MNNLINANKSKLGAGIVAIISALMIMALAGSAVAESGTTVVDDGKDAGELIPGQQVATQVVTLTDGGGDGLPTLIDSIVITNTSSNAASTDQFENLWVWKDEDTSGTLTSGDVQVGSTATNLENLNSSGVRFGKDDDTAAVSIGDGGTKDLIVVVTVASSATEGGKEIKTEFDASDLKSSGTSSWVSDGIDTDLTAETLDTQATHIDTTTAVDSTGDGKLDKIVLTMTDDLKSNRPSSSAFTVKTESGESIPVDSVAAGGATTEEDTISTISTEVAIDLEDTGKVIGTGAPTVTYTAGASVEIKDTNGLKENFFSVTVTDDASPVMKWGAYKDTNNDGTVDNVVVQFSENVASYTWADVDWDETTNDSDSIFTTTAAASTEFDSVYSQADNWIQFNVASGSVQADTTGGNTETLEVSGGVTDGAGNTVGIDSVDLVDTAAPVRLSANTVSGTADPLPNEVSLTFTEGLASTTSVDNFTVSGTLTTTSLSTTTLTDDTVTLTWSSEFGTGETPSVDYVVADADGNIRDNTVTPSDTVGPVLEDAYLNDVNGDGYPTPQDEVILEFSENMNTTTVAAGDLSMGYGSSPTLLWSSNDEILTITLDTGETVDLGSTEAGDGNDQDGNPLNMTPADKEIQLQTGPIVLDGVRYRSIGTAVSEADSYVANTEPADTIEVGADYDSTNEASFPITIDKAGLTVKAASGTTPVIDAAKEPEAVKINTTGEVTFQGFTVKGFADSGVFQSVGDGTDDGPAHILNNIVKGPATGEPHGNSIQVVGDNSTVIGNEIKGTINTAEWEGAGIQVVIGDDVVIENNWVYSADTAISVFALNGDTSIVVNPVVGTVVENNTVEDSVRGIRIDAQETGNFDESDVEDTTIRYNVVDNNEIGIEIFEDGHTGDSGETIGTIASYNNLVNNDNFGVWTNIATGTVDAINNYWGDDSGPSDVGDGAGDAVSANVDYSPWLVSKDGSTYDFTYVLDEGMNLVSLPLIPADSSISTVIGPTENVNTVWGWSNENKSWSNYSPGAQTNDLTTMVAGKGYWIIMDNADTMTVSGRERMPPAETQRSNSVFDGWNLIGFRETSQMTRLQYLGTELNNYTVRCIGFQNGSYTDPIGSSEYLKPGYGYWLAVSELGTIYP